MPVGDGAHDGAHGQAVEIVVDEDQHAQDESGDLRAHAGLDVGLGPASEGRAAAGLVDHGHQDAQDDQEAQVAGQIRNGHGQAVHDDHVQGADQVEACGEESADQNAGEQGGVDLLGDERQHDGQQRGNQSPKGTVHNGLPPEKKSVNSAVTVHNTKHKRCYDSPPHFCDSPADLLRRPRHTRTGTECPSAMAPFTAARVPARTAAATDGHRASIMLCSIWVYYILYRGKVNRKFDGFGKRLEIYAFYTGSIRQIRRFLHGYTV